jgi:hypothetical protein
MRKPVEKLDHHLMRPPSSGPWTLLETGKERIVLQARGKIEAPKLGANALHLARQGMDVAIVSDRQPRVAAERAGTSKRRLARGTKSE